MKKLILVSLGMALLSSNARAISFSGSIDQLNKTYESVSSVIENDQESLYAELMVKEGLINAIEFAENINEMVGVNEIHPNARYATIPAGLASILLVKGGYKVTDSIARFIFPENGMKAYLARYKELSASVRASYDEIVELTLKALASDDTEEVRKLRLEVEEKALNLKNQKRLLTQHITTKPGILRKSLSTLRGAARFTIAFGAISVGIAIVGETLVIILPEETKELLEDLHSDVERLEKLLQVVDDSETNNE